jgi:hypothetical protein
MACSLQSARPSPYFNGLPSWDFGISRFLEGKLYYKAKTGKKLTSLKTDCEGK